MSLLDYVSAKYPKKFKVGIRSINEHENFIEIMFNGGQTLYLSKNYGD